jgi:tetratricopeptide (TPR) repeat protein
MKAFQEELRVADGAGDSAGRAQATESIASIMSEEELYPQARAMLRNALTMAEADGEGIMAGYNAAHAALIAGELGDVADAHAFLDKARGYSIGNAALAGRSDFVEGRLASFEGQPRRAIQLLLRAERASSPEDEEARAEDDSYIATQEFLIGQTGSALRRAQSAFDTVCKLKIRPLERQMRLNIAFLNLRSGKPQQAILLLSGGDSGLFDFFESAWRAHTILAQANAVIGEAAEAANQDSAARRALAALKANWGKPNYSSWCRRADIQACAAIISRAGGGATSQP